MLGKRKRGGLASGSSQRKKISIISPEEIAFDYSAREDYLTGFHKRKVQRIKHAQEETAKKEKEERIKARKIVRPKHFLFIAGGEKEMSGGRCEWLIISSCGCS